MNTTRFGYLDAVFDWPTYDPPPIEPSTDSEVTTFQRLFFAQLEKLPGRRHAALLKQARRLGIPRECAEAYWRTVRKPALSSPAESEEAA